MIVYMKYLEITEDKHKPALDELNKHAKNGGESVIALTAPWCGHCNAMKPELKRMRSKLKGGKGIVANVSDKYHAQLDMDTQVDGFPTVRHFKGGKKVRDYEGKRAAEELANFANNSLNSAVQTGAVQVGGGKRKKTRIRRKRASKSNKGGRRKKTRRKKRKPKRKKIRRKTRKRGGGLCASRQALPRYVQCQEMTAIKTHTFLPSKLKSSSPPLADSSTRGSDGLWGPSPPSLIVKIGTDDICYKIGRWVHGPKGWLRENTKPMLAVALWLKKLNENYNWIPERSDPNGLFTAQAIKEEIYNMINKHRSNN